MSATADIARYRDYFKDLGRDERVEVLGIPITGQKTIFEKRVSYLEEAITSIPYWNFLSSLLEISFIYSKTTEY